MQPWIIARVGTVSLQAASRPLARFSLVQFNIERPYPPEHELAQHLRRQLPGKKGYFQVEGDVPGALLAAIEDGETLTVCCDARGGKLEVDVQVDGQLTALSAQATHVPFVVAGSIYFTVPSPE